MFGRVENKGSATLREIYIVERIGEKTHKSCRVTLMLRGFFSRIGGQIEREKNYQIDAVTGVKVFLFLRGSEGFVSRMFLPLWHSRKTYNKYIVCFMAFFSTL